MFLERIGDIQDTIPFYVFAAVAGLNLIIAIVLLVVGCCMSNTIPGSSIDFYIAFGGIALEACVLLRGLQSEWMNESIIGSLCEVHPALLTFGLMWFIGGLLVKASSIFHFYRNDGEKPNRSEWQPNLWLLLLMLIDVIIVLVWTLKYQPHIQPSLFGVNIYECTGEKFTEMEIIVSAFHAILLVLAALLVWPAVHYTRKLNVSFMASLLAVIIYNTLFVAIAGTLAFFYAGKIADLSGVEAINLYNENPDIKYAVNGGLIGFAVFIALLLLLIGKLKAAKMANAESDEEYDQVGIDKGYE